MQSDPSGPMMIGPIGILHPPPRAAAPASKAAFAASPESLESDAVELKAEATGEQSEQPDVPFLKSERHTLQMTASG
jgi:hypothetical protein